MIFKTEFDEERKTCEKLTHIEEEISDPALIEIDRLFGAADVLSIKYAQKHYNKVRNISIIAPLIVFLFLLYDEAELHLLIFAVLLLIIILYLIYRKANNENVHDKYLEYRVLAESLRVQYFISKAGIKENVKNILPWLTKIRIPLVKNVLSEIPTATNKKEPIINCWIRDQMKYHDDAHKRASAQKKRNDRYEKISLIATIFFYAITLGFEVWMMYSSPFDPVTANWIRAALKIGVGTSSAITIFLANYYGKMSLSSKIDEHLRMHWLYNTVEYEIMERKEEDEELIMHLAREFLIENAIWYSHQKKNKPDFAVE